MATTTNYGWTTPDDTALVKDGASAIRSLGTSVDTTTKNLNPSTTLGDIEYRSATANTNTRLAIGTTGQVLSVVGGVPAWATSDDANAIQNAIVDAKGDLISATAADTPARLAVGANDTVLTADSSTATGLKWAAPASGGGMTLINTGGTTFSGASVTISSIPSTYKKLEIFIVNPRPATDEAVGTIRFNGSSTANTYFNGEGAQIEGDTSIFNVTAVNFCYGTDNGTQASLAHITIPDYANTTTWKYATVSSIVRDFENAANVNILWAIGVRNNTEAISSLEFLWSSGNATSGTIYVYGVN